MTCFPTLDASGPGLSHPLTFPVRQVMTSGVVLFSPLSGVVFDVSECLILKGDYILLQFKKRAFLL